MTFTTKKECLEISIANRDPLEILRAYQNLGDAYFNRGELDIVIDYYEKGLQLATDIHYWMGTIKIGLKLGSTYLLLNQNEKAISYFPYELVRKNTMTQS